MPLILLPELTDFPRGENPLAENSKETEEKKQKIEEAV